MRRERIVPRSDPAGRTIGLIVFLLGVALLIFVAVLAYNLYTSDTAAFPLTPANGSTAAPTTARLGQAAVVLFVKIGLLFILAIVGSMLAGRGIQLYFTSKEPGQLPSEE